MRNNYPLLSQEINDRFLHIYSHLLYLLGNNDDTGNRVYDGIYDKIMNNDGEFYDKIPKYVTMPNSIDPGDGSITRYLDKMSYIMKLRRL